MPFHSAPLLLLLVLWHLTKSDEGSRFSNLVFNSADFGHIFSRCSRKEMLSGGLRLINLGHFGLWILLLALGWFSYFMGPWFGMGHGAIIFWTVPSTIIYLPLFLGGFSMILRWLFGLRKSDMSTLVKNVINDSRKGSSWVEGIRTRLFLMLGASIPPVAIWIMREVFGTEAPKVAKLVLGPIPVHVGLGFGLYSTQPFFVISIFSWLQYLVILGIIAKLVSKRLWQIPIGLLSGLILNGFEIWYLRHYFSL